MKEEGREGGRDRRKEEIGKSERERVSMAVLLLERLN